MAWKILSIALASSLLLPLTGALDNGLAITPQMGWDNWNSFGCDVSETLLQETAQLIVEYGLKDLGYYYVILDDCWSKGRNTTGHLIPDPEKFPRGMAHVADDMHELGLGFGMYSSAGKYTCGQFAGSLGYEEIDAQTWASWGVDYLKYDNCYNEGQAGTQILSYERYATMSRALNATGRPILYSLCNWGEDYPFNWASTIANSWRISGDIMDDWDKADARCPCDGENAWDCRLPGFHCSVTNIMNKASFITSKAQPGAWNDLDMLEVGNGAMTDAEYVAHFSMWAVVKSPLILGNDLRKMTAADLTIISNPAVIAINQDPAGSSASRRWMYSTNETDINGRAEIQMWSGRLTSTTGGTYSDYVVLLVNGNNKATELNATLADIFVDSGPRGTAPQVKISWEVRDLWTNRMSVEQGQAIISTNGTGNATTIIEERYNATKTSYAAGLAQKNEFLLGNVTTTVQPSGTIIAKVEPHGAALFRLRAIPTALKRDEL
ncbi:glycoside hydrolase family 27 protein [Bisporella sp. PMI_857]|nr:glycoside hydrolase family 27 protein [Bisporella sp. PMI_857]